MWSIGALDQAPPLPPPPKKKGGKTQQQKSRKKEEMSLNKGNKNIYEDREERKQLDWKALESEI